jgi:hypothetical protein
MHIRLFIIILIEYIKHYASNNFFCIWQENKLFFPNKLSFYWNISLILSKNVLI